MSFEGRVFEDVINDPVEEAKQAAWSAEKSASKAEVKPVEALPPTEAINNLAMNAEVVDPGLVAKLAAEEEIKKIREQLAADDAHVDQFLKAQPRRYASDNTAQLKTSDELRRRHAGQQQIGLG